VFRNNIYFCNMNVVNFIKRISLLLILLTFLIPLYSQISFPNLIKQDSLISDDTKDLKSYENIIYGQLYFKKNPESLFKKKLLENFELTFLGYKGDGKYFISIPQKNLKALEKSNLVAKIYQDKTEDKICPNLLQNLAFTDEFINLMVLNFPNIPAEFKRYKTIDKQSEIEILQEFHHISYIRIKPAYLTEIASIPYVLYITGINKPIPLDLGSTVLHKANVVTSNLSGKYGLSGQNVNVGVWDYAGIQDHPDFSERYHNFEPYVTTFGFGEHATRVAGLIASRGNVNPYGIGMAPKSKLKVWDAFGFMVAEMDTAIPNQNLAVINNSYTTDSSTTCINRGIYDINSFIGIGV
jgi:subtilisin family serine protease